ncbi:MAG TPA: hypothetical protein VJ302_36720 [Blastocatellia bacterium]|nr:hypothetical protein [Blastocatellia bacterium]
MWKRSLKQRANLIAALIAAVIVIVGWGLTLVWRIGTVNPRIRIERGGEEQLQARLKEVEIREVAQIMDGEVASTAGRVRSACSVALIATMVSVKERPAGTPGLLQRIADQSLLPPGVTRRGDRQLETRSDVLSVRSQMNPLKIEVVSVAKEQRFGPGLLVRLAAELFEGQGVQLWVSKTLDRVVLPPPFVMEQELIGLGWRQEPLSGAQGGSP